MTRREQARWVAYAAVALLAVAGAARLLRQPPAFHPPDAPAGAQVVQLARPGGEDPLLREETVLRDPRPLFLPTVFNAAAPEPRREAGRALLDLDRIAEDPGEADAAVVRGLPPVAVLNGRPPASAGGVDALGSAQGEVGAVGLGRGERRVDPLPPRGGFVHVISAVSGATVLAEALPGTMGPVGGRSWEPLEIFAVVDAGGLAAPLSVVRSSSVEEVDLHFRRILEQGFRLGARLPPGFFRIVVGP